MLRSTLDSPQEQDHMTFDDETMRIAIAWRNLRRVKTQTLSVPVPQGQLDTMDVMANLGPCSMVELSSALRIDASTATRAVDRLVESGLADRQRSPADGRTVMVALTKAGRTLERKLTEERMAHMTRTLDQLSANERTQLARSLEKLVRASDAANHPDAALVPGD